jgi:predicted nuclease with TOPRIM domain
MRAIMNEELVSKQLETNENRLNDHADRIRELEKSKAVTDEKIDNLCKSIEKQTKSINALIGTFASALVGFFFYAVQQGIFK